MDSNTCLLYNGVNEVYNSLLIFCSKKGFNVEKNNEKYYFLSAKKTSLFFWKNLRLEFEILTVEKKEVQVKCMIYMFGIRQPKLENEYTIAIENLF